MNSGKQVAIIFTVLLIVYTLFDYFFLRGHGSDAAPEATPAGIQTSPASDKQ